MNIRQSVLLILMTAALTACGSDSNDPAPAPDAPVLSAIGDMTVLQGTELTLNITATDPNGDALVFSATATGANDPLNLASPATFTTNPDLVSASFIWTPDTTVQTLGDYNMKFTVTDDSAKRLSDSETMTITVIDRVGQGRILYSDNCGDCHGFEGTAGTIFPAQLTERTAAVMNSAFASPGSQMGITDTDYSLDQLNMISEYLTDYFCNANPNQCG